MIRTLPMLACPVCGQPGTPLYENLRDGLFAAPGEWSIRSCHAAGCGGAWLDPRPTNEDLPKVYTEYYTHTAASSSAKVSWRKRLYLLGRRGYLASRYGYDIGTGGWLARGLGRLLRLHGDLRARVDLEAFHLPCSPDGKFLEVGCGAGDHLVTMSELGWQVQGIDVDPSAVATARSRGLLVKCGNLEQAGFAAHSFDAIGLSHVIEHVDDTASLLRACRQLLRPNGHLVLVTPNLSSYGHARYGKAWMSLDPPRHLRIYVPNTLERVVREAGFTRVETWTGGRDAKVSFLASRAIQKTGRWTWGARGSLLQRLDSRMQHALARLWSFWKPTSGEEIILRAQP